MEMDVSKSERYLAWYSGVVTLAFAAVVLTGASAARSEKFDQIDVQRINVREADGTLRMVVSNSALAPGLSIRGKEYPHSNQGKRGAGMWFYNGEGSEMGGLTFDGRRGADGKVAASGHLSFDQYEQDQVIVISQEEYEGRRAAGLRVIERPDESLEKLIPEVNRIRALPQPEQARRMAELTQGYQGGPRLFLGRDPDRATVLDMKDARGLTRLRFTVAADGAAKIEFVGADGKVQRSLTPDDISRRQ
jgi:hypothetical protein